MADITVCSLETLTGSMIHGTLCEAELNGQLISLFITISPVLTTTSPNDFRNAILQLPKAEKEVRIPLQSGSVHHVWLHHSLKTSVIELSAEIANDFKLEGADFMKTDFLKVGVTSPNEEVHFLSF